MTYLKLNYWGQMAQVHWKKHLPIYYKHLYKHGILEQTLQEAGENAKNMLADLMEGGMHRNEAEEIVLPQFILLPPEKDQEETTNQD